MTGAAGKRVLTAWQLCKSAPRQLNAGRPLISIVLVVRIARSQQLQHFRTEAGHRSAFEGSSARRWHALLALHRLDYEGHHRKICSETLKKGAALQKSALELGIVRLDIEQWRIT